MKDLERQIEELAEEHALSPSAGLVDPGKFYSFVAGSKATLSLLAAPREGHWPRVWVEHGDDGLHVRSYKPLVGPDMNAEAYREYCDLAEPLQAMAEVE